MERGSPPLAACATSSTPPSDGLGDAPTEGAPFVQVLVVQLLDIRRDNARHVRKVHFSYVPRLILYALWEAVKGGPMVRREAAHFQHTREADSQRLSPELALELPAEILEAPLRVRFPSATLITISQELATLSRISSAPAIASLTVAERASGPESAQRAAWASSNSLI